jgi:peptidoglycan/xylan/chitin deacetylase (PgdA/CDA1 family)
VRTLRSLPGVWHAARAVRAVGGALRRRSPRGVILTYHRIAGPRPDPLLLDVSASNFDAQLSVLSRTAAPLRLDEFESLRREGRLPARAVAVTFDDGYADNLHAAAPLLERHEIPATVFVTAGMIGSARGFPWDEADAGLPSHRALTVDELRALAVQKGISIGAHTMTHPSLAKLTRAEQAREIGGSITWLEQTTGSRVRALAYPFGTPGDVSASTVRVASRLCDYALSTDSGAAWRWSPRWRLPRATVRDWNAEEFARHLDRWFAA